MNTHEEIHRLLPWYVNGTLDERDMAKVQAHLTGCADCRETVSTELHDARLLHLSDKARLARLVGAGARQFEVLRPRLQPSVPPQPRSSLRFVALAAVVVVSIAVPTLLVQRSAEPTFFELRTNRLAGEVPVLQLVFTADTSERDIELLISTAGTLLGVPSEHGVYRIALSTENPESLLGRIREHPSVRWAEIEL